jgi:hypothetical protein
MPAKPEDPNLRPATDEAMTERNRGTAERVALGSNPTGSIVRIIAAVVIFILVFGSIFYFQMR